MILIRGICELGRRARASGHQGWALRGKRRGAAQRRRHDL